MEGWRQHEQPILALQLKQKPFLRKAPHDRLPPDH